MNHRAHAAAAIAVLMLLCSGCNQSEMMHNLQKPDAVQPSWASRQQKQPPQFTKPTRPTEPTQETAGPLYTRGELEAMDNEKHGYGQGTHVDAANRPTGAVNTQNAYGHLGAWFLAPENGNIYLTFDLGYENGYTAKILDILAEKDVKAVFFVTMSYCVRNPELVQRILDEGHQLGNHSVNHISMPTLTIDQMVEEIMGLHDYVYANFGYRMHLFRPPKGEYSERSLAVAQNLGYQSVNWSYAYRDYDVANQPDPAEALEKVTAAAHSGAIYLLHGVSATNAEILPELIDAFRQAGYVLALFS